MKRIILLILFNVALFTSCSEEGKNNTNAGTVEYFKENLRKYMNFAALVRCFGEPSRDIGSGIHIYVYVLNDSTEIWISFTDAIFYGRHMDKNQQILSTLI